MTKIKCGELLLISEGDHSDYDIVTVVKATTDFDIFELKEKYLERFPEQGLDYKFDEIQFTEWLITNTNVVEKVEYQEWHLGSYALGNMSLREGAI